MDTALNGGCKVGCLSLLSISLTLVFCRNHSLLYEWTPAIQPHSLPSAGVVRCLVKYITSDALNESLDTNWIRLLLMLLWGQRQLSLADTFRVQAPRCLFTLSGTRSVWWEDIKHHWVWITIWSPRYFDYGQYNIYYLIHSLISINEMLHLVEDLFLGIKGQTVASNWERPDSFSYHATSSDRRCQLKSNLLIQQRRFLRLGQLKFI